jgi:hypothetical protein
MSSEIEIEFARAKANGWIPMFQDAGKSFGFTPGLLMAIASRETNMQNIEGDFGHDGPHGFGCMQIDIGTERQFCLSGGWKNVEATIHMGASILASKQVQIQKGQGVTLAIPGRTFVGAKLSFAQINRTAVAAYNAGLLAYYAMTVHGNPDLYTTQQNYSADVIAKMQVFSALLTGG